MKKFILVHRWSGGPEDDWRPWLKTELENLGCEVLVPEMPETDTPRIDAWVSHLENISGENLEDTYFVGHSIGGQAIMRMIEKSDKKVGGAFFVSGWFNLENLEDEEVAEIAKPWIETPIDTSKLKELIPHTSLVISDNDPFGYFEYNKEKFSEIGANIVVLHNAGHITEDDGYKELPELLEEIKKIL
ncbi:serine hydrolase family protein [Candidatus Nomurabacteria bacterium]|nr:serine hydrolase family protein [Candidatus Nomurabacteria bacterium]USN95042.1 MAG: serine hydrolase family protein [Candidatus Nomurabacteria bacterium]